jgi:hypothetical protein
MTRTPSRFRQADVTRAMKAVKAAGVAVARIEVEPSGKVIIVAGQPAEGVMPAENEWDVVLDHGKH